MKYKEPTVFGSLRVDNCYSLKWKLKGSEKDCDSRQSIRLWHQRSWFRVPPVPACSYLEEIGSAVFCKYLFFHGNPHLHFIITGKGIVGDIACLSLFLWTDGTQSTQRSTDCVTIGKDLHLNHRHRINSICSAETLKVFILEHQRIVCLRRSGSKKA